MANSLNQQPKKTRTPKILAWLVVVIGIIFIGLLVLMVKASPQVGAWLATTTPPCVQPMLLIGSDEYPIRTITRNADGTVPVPTTSEHAAFWLADTQGQYMFLLEPSQANLDLPNRLKSGDRITITWADCSKDEYVVQAIHADQPLDVVFSDTSSGGVAILEPSGSAQARLVIIGVRPELLVTNTTAPVEENVVQIDLTFGAVTSDSTTKTVNIELTITNRGAKTLTLKNSDLSILDLNGAELPPFYVSPSLPQEIQPAASLALSVVFPLPPGVSSAVLKIFDVTAEIYLQ